MSSHTASLTPDDPYDPRLATRASGLLRGFNQAGVLSAADVHVARRLGRLGGEADERVLLAAALTVRGVRLGSVCLDLTAVRDAVAGDEALGVPVDTSAPAAADGLAWPEPATWLHACSMSPLVDTDPAQAVGEAPPMRLVDGLLYLDRYWQQEQVVRAELDTRTTGADLSVDTDAVRAALTGLFPGAAPDRQRLAAAMTALRPLTVLVGGPGTGKTTTVARLLALLRRLPGDEPRIALAAPTGKAAARLQGTVQQSGLGLEDVQAQTIHRLLGRQPGSRSRFRHHRDNRLPYDVVVVDETSMVSLTLMSRLCEAVRPDARLVLVGDPDQLASVEAGAVLGDVVERPPPPLVGPRRQLGQLAAADLGPDGSTSHEVAACVVRLSVTHRFGAEIAELAAAIRGNDPDGVLELLRAGGPAVSFVDTDPPDPARLADVRDDAVVSGRALVDAARAGDVAAALDQLDRHRLLCAHRRGPYGVVRWGSQVERWLAAAMSDYAADGEWYLGRPLLVDANDYELALFNGDTGVVVAADGRPTAAFRRGTGPLLVGPTRLSGVETVHAMTVHRAQGSQFDRVTLLLPPVESPLLTREMFYTAVTRAQSHVRVIASEQAIRRAVGRPITRASGLRR